MLLASVALVPVGLLSNAVFAQDAQEANTQPKAAAFDIWEYRLEGNTLLSKVTIERALYPYLGPEKSIEDVQRAAENLERIYRDAGYPAIYVDIPPQDVVAGVVKLHVTEGKIGRVVVRGARYFTPSGIREKLPSLNQGEPLAAADVQKDIRDLNAVSPDLKVAPVLKPGKTQGQIDVELKVKDTLPLHGDIEYNNFNSADTTRGRMRASISYDNLWQQAHSFGLSYQTAPEKTSELRVLSLSYGMPLGDDYRLAAYAVSSKTSVNTAVDASVGGNTLNVLGNGDVLGVRVIHPLPNQEHYFQSVNLGADYKYFTQDVEGVKQPIQYAALSVQYGGTVVEDNALTSITIGTTFGTRGVFDNTEQFAAKRQNATPGFFYLNGGIQRTDNFSNDWQWLSRLRWQLSPSPLINNEQFSIGGFTSVRGYYESQALGDRGYSAGFELRTPSAAKWFGDSIDEIRALAFWDWGQVRVNEAGADQTDHFNLEAAGLGIRVQAFNQLRALLGVAYPLKNEGAVERGDLRTDFQLIYGF